MPRVHPNVLAITPPTTSTKASSSRRIGSRLLMWFGASLIGLLVIDNFLQYQNAKEAHEKIAQLAKEEEEFRQALLKEWKDKPALFLVKAVFKYKMGGTMGLRGVTVGDVMEVLQENVGPNKGYYLCRTKDSDGQISSIGWYPTSFVEKIELKPSAQKKSKFLGLF